MKLSKFAPAQTTRHCFSSLDDQGTTFRVNLREQSLLTPLTEVVIKFKGTVPEIDPDETSLTTHVVKQVSAALAQ